MISLIILMIITSLPFFFFFFNDTATTEIYTLSLHDALPIYCTYRTISSGVTAVALPECFLGLLPGWGGDRKSTRLNSSHDQISYAVFCLKKKKKKYQQTITLRSHTHTCRQTLCNTMCGIT